MEGNVKKAVQKVLERRGAWSVKYWGTALGIVGVPDILACYRGRFVAFELKQPGKKATKIQEHVHTEIRKCGGLVFTITSGQEAEGTLDLIDVYEDARGVLNSGRHLASPSSSSLW